jgi:hypothetical protein
MKILIPHIVRPLPLKEYAPEMNGAVLQVWVNPTREFIQKFNTILEQDDQIAAWYAELLSQATAQETHWTAAELQQIYESDPALWAFIVGRCWDLIGEHRTALEKKATTP